MDWQRLPPAAGRVRAIGGAVFGLVLSGPLGIALGAQVDGLFARVSVFLVVMLVLVFAMAWLGRARWRNTRWKLDAQGFHVRRGWLWRTEVLVPRTRVQHLDIERGPVERHFGLATLVVHTAGSQTAALQQSGLADHDAVALRDALIPAASHESDAL
jgi:membrane protein YdbS with pleckstrin-like domain